MEFEKVRTNRHFFMAWMLSFFFIFYGLGVKRFFKCIFFVHFLLRRIGSKQDEYQEQYASETNNNSNNHQKEELDAAEALTFLAGNFKSQWVK